MKRHNSKGVLESRKLYDDDEEEIGWELRPGGMLVHKRGYGVVALRAIIKVKVSHGSYHHQISLPAKSTFGDLKRLLTNDGLEPKEQRLLFRGKEKEDEECLHMVGVKDMSKVVFIEGPTSKERKLQDIKKDHEISNSYEAVFKVSVEVDKLTKKVSALEFAVQNGGRYVKPDLYVIATPLSSRK